MTTYTPVSKNTTTYTSESKTTAGSGLVFFGWLFWFTQAGTTAITYTAQSKNSTTYTPITKN